MPDSHKKLHPVIYFRSGDHTEPEELEAAQRHFNVVQMRTQILINSLVIPRYSFLPYPEELCSDMHNIGAKLINTLQQHMYVADIWRYYPDISHLTPKTYSQGWNNLPEGSYVVKGSTNSRKHEWNRRMFAKTKADIRKVVDTLLDDSLISMQGLFVREYVPLRKFEEGINGLPITNEWRVFVLGGKVLIGGYYWASEPDCCPTENPMDVPQEALNLVEQVIQCVGDKCNFYAVDVAEKESGGWIVVELNDGMQSGLSMIDADEFYGKLHQRVMESGS